MSSWSGGEKRSGSSKGWRGKKAGPSQPAHAWQSRRSGRAARGRVGGRRWEGRWRLYTLLGALLLGLFLYLLLVRPAKTPVLMITGIRYAAPVPPNQWALEDRDALLELDRTLSIAQITGSWSGSESVAWEAFRAELASHKALRRGFRSIREPLVIYFSMPGVVDEDGNPCLLPPEASPLAVDGWLKIDSLVKQIAKIVPGERPKLLVLDSNQELVNWDMGIVYNTFTERLKLYVKTCDVPNLAILTAADEGQVSWVSPQLGGSVFGQFLRLGLAGEADRDGPSPDGEVSLQELVAYLQAEVDGWARSNRASGQQPTLMPTERDLDFFVTHAMSSSALDSYRDALISHRAPPPAVTVEEMGRLWSGLEDLQKSDVLRYDPVALGNYRKRLLRLESLAYGGSAYKTDAELAAKELQNLFRPAEDESRRESRALGVHWGVTSPDAKLIQPGKPLHSLPLCEFFGSVDQSTSSGIENLWRQLGGFKPAAGSDASLIQTALRFEETQLLVAAHQQQVGESGDGSGQLRRVLDLRARAERLAVPRDSEGVPGDERAHYYVRPAVDAADVQRRLAEDALFVQMATDAERQQLIAAANKAYDLAAAIRDKMKTTLAICDAAWAETPYLAEQLCRPGAGGRFAHHSGQIDGLLRLIRSNHELGEAIGGLHDFREDAVNHDPGEAVDRFVVFAEDLETQLRQHRDDFTATCKDLREPVQDGAEMLAFDRVLVSPLIDASLRPDLLKKRDELAAWLCRDHFSKKSAGRTAAAAQRDGRQRLPEFEQSDGLPAIAEAMAEWDASPLVAILDPEQSEHGSPVNSDDFRLRRLEADCWFARMRLGAVAELSAEGMPSFDGGNDAYLDERLALGRGERRLRAAAPLLFERLENDPVARLRRFDLQQLLLWHARRTLDGFWHEVSSPDPKTIQELLAEPVDARRIPLPYFASAAEDYLGNAEKLIEPTPGVRRQIDRLEQVLQQRRDASRYGLRIAVRSQAVTTTVADVTVEIEPHPDGPHLPRGRLAVYLAAEQSRLAEVSPQRGNWGSLDVPIDKDGTEPQEARAHNASQPELDVVAFFRGRPYRRAFAPHTLGGTVVRYGPPRYDWQSVTLYGDQPSPPSVVFTLDCSGSMYREIAGERAGEKNSRIEVAKSVLTKMLVDLASRRGSSRPRVGAWFFGHRVKWKENAPAEIVTNEEAASGPVSKDLVPANDVERVLPLGSFRGQELGLITDRLQPLVHHGLTPVNLTILRALAEFDDDDDNYSKSIIVITDGKNDQRHPVGGSFKAVQTTTPEAVIRAWDRIGKDIPVYIIGFGIPKSDQQESDQQAELEFKKIADHTGGEWLPTESGNDLVEFLRKRLDVHGYVVIGPNGRPVIRDPISGDPERVELNTEVDISLGDFPMPVDLTVEFQSISKQVRFEGGEKLELAVNRNGDDIINIPYDVDVAERGEAELVRGESGQPTDLLLRVHRPRRSDDDRVKFRFSVQDQNSHFTPRPDEVWIEVTPDGSEESYVFYDTVFEPHTPVPVVSFSASNWPSGVDHARVKFWCRGESTTPVKSIPLNEVRGQDVQTARYEPLPTVPGVGVRVGLETAGADESGDYRVVVEEQYQDPSLASGAVRISLKLSGAAPRATSVLHRFDAPNHVARHEFVFAGEMTEADFAEQVTVQIASAVEIKKNAFQLEDRRGLRVRVVNEDATHVPSGEVGSR